MKKLSSSLGIAAMALCLHIVPAMAQPLSIVVSIPPLAPMVHMVTKDAASIDVLLGAGQSAHNIHLKPSQSRLLSNADVVVWIDPSLEGGIIGKTDDLAANATSVIATAIPSIHLIALTEPHDHGDHDGHDDHDEHHDSHDDHGNHGHDDHEKHDGHHDDHDGHDDHGHHSKHDDHDDHGDHHDEHKHNAHAPYGFDPHIWLDARNAMVIVDHLAQVLAKLDPSNADRFAENAAQSIQELEKLDQDLLDLAPQLAQKPVMVFHDAFAYYQARYQANVAGIFRANIEIPVSAKAMQNIIKQIKQSQVSCVFTEVQFSPAQVETIANDYGLRTRQIDLLGSQLPVESASYRQLMQSLADAFLGC